MGTHDIVKSILLEHLDSGVDLNYATVEVITKQIVTAIYKKITSDVYLSMITKLQMQWLAINKGDTNASQSSDT